MKTLRYVALISAKVSFIYAIIMSSLTTGICGTTAYSEEYHRWTVVYRGEIYEYVATTYDNPESYIITIDGEKIYVRDIIGGDNK